MNQFRYTGIFLMILFSVMKARGQDPDFHIYLCFGQSNMAGAGTIESQDRNVDERYLKMMPVSCSDKTMGEWSPAEPPLTGCSGGLGPADYFGRTLVEKLPGIKVGVVVVAVPGCAIELFGTGPADYESLDQYSNVPSQFNHRAYDWLLYLAKKAQADGVIRGFILHQGESNPNDWEWPDKVKAIYDQLIEDCELNAEQIPLLAGELLYTNQGGACGAFNEIMAELPNTLPNSYVVSAEGLSGKDQFHFTTESNREFGKRYGEKMLEVLATGSTSGRPAVAHRPLMPSIAEGVPIGIDGDFTYRIMDISGTVVENGNRHTSRRIGTTLAPGVYLLSIERYSRMFSQLLVKKQ